MKNVSQCQRIGKSVIKRHYIIVVYLHSNLTPLLLVFIIAFFPCLRKCNLLNFIGCEIVEWCWCTWVFKCMLFAWWLDSVQCMYIMWIGTTCIPYICMSKVEGEEMKGYQPYRATFRLVLRFESNTALDFEAKKDRWMDGWNRSSWVLCCVLWSKNLHFNSFLPSSLISESCLVRVMNFIAIIPS